MKPNYKAFILANRDKLTSGEKRAMKQASSHIRKLNDDIKLAKLVRRIDELPDLADLQEEKRVTQSHLTRLIAGVHDRITLAEKRKVEAKRPAPKTEAPKRPRLSKAFVEAAAAAGDPWAQVLMAVADPDTACCHEVPVAKINPKKIAVLKSGSFTVNRKTAVELFNKLHELLQNKDWVDHPDNRAVVDFKSV